MLGYRASREVSKVTTEPHVTNGRPVHLHQNTPVFPSAFSQVFPLHSKPIDDSLQKVSSKAKRFDSSPTFHVDGAHFAA